MHRSQLRRSALWLFSNDLHQVHLTRNHEWFASQETPGTPLRDPSPKISTLAMQLQLVLEHS